MGGNRPGRRWTRAGYQLLRAGGARRTRWASRYPWTWRAKVVVRESERRWTRRRSDLQQGGGLSAGRRRRRMEGAAGRTRRRVCVSAFGHRLCLARSRCLPGLEVTQRPLSLCTVRTGFHSLNSRYTRRCQRHSLFREINRRRRYYDSM